MKHGITHSCNLTHTKEPGALSPLVTSLLSFYDDRAVSWYVDCARDAFNRLRARFFPIDNQVPLPARQFHFHCLGVGVVRDEQVFLLAWRFVID